MRATSPTDYRELARRRLPRFPFEYVDGGTFDEVTLTRNADLGAVALRQRVMRDISERPFWFQLYMIRDRAFMRRLLEQARLVMEQSRHVMLTGRGAEELALERGLAPVPNSYFTTERRRLELGQTLRGEPGGRDFDRRHDGQALGPHRGLAGYRRRHLRSERLLSGVGHRPRRVLHPRGRRPRDRIVDALPGIGHRLCR